MGEIETPGCALVYPTGKRAFFSLCGDGAALQVQLDDNGREASKSRTAQLFDPLTDPVTEKGVRLCRPSELVLDLLDNPVATFVKEDGETVTRPQR